MKKTSDIFRSAKQLVKEFSGLGNSKHYILINDCGIFYLLLGGKSGYLAINTLHSHYPDFKQSLDRFISDLKKYPLFVGQPVTLLIGGSKCFYHIEQSKNKEKINPSKKFSWVDMENTIIRFRIFDINDGQKCAFYSGIESDSYNRIIRQFYDEEVTITDVRPVTIFILEKWLKNNVSGSLIIKLPGEIISLLHTDYRISIIEQNLRSVYSSGLPPNILKMPKETLYYSFFDRDIGNKDSNTKPLSELIRASILETVRDKYFWGPVVGVKTPALIKPVLNGLRLSAIVLIGICVLLLLASVTLRLWKTAYEDTMVTYQTEYNEKTRIQAEIESLESRLDMAFASNYHQTLLSSAITAFCQRRPFGLYLNEIKANHDNEHNWRVTATGLAENESAVFSYRDYISQNTANLPLEVTALQETNAGNRSGDSRQKILYGFKIGLDLGDNR